MSELVEPTPLDRYAHHFVVSAVETKDGIRFHVTSDDSFDSDAPIWDEDPDGEGGWLSYDEAYPGARQADQRMETALRERLAGDDLPKGV